MPDTAAEPVPCFPNDDALCERCGYPLRGMAIEAVCPECGLAVEESSPAKRDRPLSPSGLLSVSYWRILGLVLSRPRNTFRSMPIDGSNRRPFVFLLWTSLLAGLLYSGIGFAAEIVITQPQKVEENIFRAVLRFLVIFNSVVVLTHIEMLGVAAFSRRRGWRVPMHLAFRVCCYASVAWVPGVALASMGMSWLQFNGVGEPWFERLVGLVRVGWMLYGGLFILSLMWFETLVWMGVRQVKFANAGAADQPQDTASATAGDGAGGDPGPP